MKPVAIMRIAAQGALGTTVAEMVAALRAGECGIRVPLHLEQTPKFAAGAGEIPNSTSCMGSWRAELLLRRTLAELLSPKEHDAIAKAPDRWGMVLGTTLAGMRHGGEGLRLEHAGRAAESDEHYGHTTASSVLGHAIQDLGLTGPTITVSCACASGLSAISHACALLEAGEIDWAIAGGYDPISEFPYGGFAALQLVAADALSPFSPDRAGMKVGEGVALMVLRRGEDALRDRSDTIIGFIAAAAESSDAHHLTHPHPQGIGAAAALARVADSNPPPQLLVAHGTGTMANDATEYEAYRAAFGSSLPRIPVVALKSRLGHPLGAAGALELVAALGCAEAGFTPTTAGRGRDATAFPDLQLLQGAVRAGAPADLIALSAGFGGANAALRVVRGANPPQVRVNAVRESEARGRPEICITAVGAVSPAGRGIDALVAHAREGCPWGHLSEEVLTPLLDRAKTRRFASMPRIMIAALRDLVESGGITPEELRDTPLIAANWTGTPAFLNEYYRDLVRSGIDLANPMLFAESVPNVGSAHCSIAMGIRAASLSVIGRRTAAVEAVALASAKIRTRAWPRAIVVAAEEAHPLTERLMSLCAGEPVPLRSSGIAILIEPASAVATPRGRKTIALHRCVGRTSALNIAKAESSMREALDPRHRCGAWFTSQSPLDRGIASSDRAATRLSIAEFGAASALASLYVGNALRSTRDEPYSILVSDPHGACWSMTAQ
ncbi:MAG: hypothetical protein K8R92_09860 [Planctomycetes bacterium]|nr:hypothetical protein [Planctomycetota bacterium]